MTSTPSASESVLSWVALMVFGARKGSAGSDVLSGDWQGSCGDAACARRKPAQPALSLTLRVAKKAGNAIGKANGLSLIRCHVLRFGTALQRRQVRQGNHRQAASRCAFQFGRAADQGLDRAIQKTAFRCGQ